MKRYITKLCVFIAITLFLIINGVESTLFVEKYTYQQPNPQITTGQCVFIYVIKIRDTQGIANLAMPTMPLPFQVQVTASYAYNEPGTSSFLIQFTLSNTIGTAPIVILSNGTNVDFNETVTCNPYPPTLTIDRQTQPYVFTTGGSYIIYTFKEDLSNATTTLNSNCVSSNPIYRCMLKPIIRGRTLQITLYIMLSLGVIQQPNNTLQDPIKVDVNLLFGPTTYSQSFIFPSPIPSYPTNSILNSITPLPNYNTTIPIKYPYLPQLMVLINSSYPKPIISSYSGILYPMLGTLDNSLSAIYFTVALPSNQTILQLTSNQTKILTQYVNFTTGSQVSINGTSFYRTNGPFQLFIEFQVFDVGEYYQVSINSKDSPPYPYGYTMFNNQISPDYKITIQTYKLNQNMIYSTFKSLGYASVGCNVSSIPPSNLYPTVFQNASLYVMSNWVYYIFQVSDQDGLNSIRIQNPSGTVMPYAPLILAEGDINNGIFVYKRKISITNSNFPYIVNQHDIIYLVDNQGNSLMTYGYAINSNIDSLPPITLIPSLTFEPWDVTYFKFIPNDVDTSNGPQKVNMVFNLTTVDVNYQPHIMFYLEPLTILPQPFGGIPFIDGYAVWDYTDKVYRMELTIPQRTANMTIKYYFENFDWGSVQISGHLGPDSELRVWSNYMDMMAPVVTSLNVFPSEVTTYTPSLGYTITVEDKPNGLKSGNLSVISTIDGNPYYFTFDSVSRTSGDIYSGTYTFTIPITNCISQRFYIQELNLIDSSGSLSHYPSTGSTYMNPFMKIYNDSSLSITLNCPLPTDIFKPIITSFTFSPKTIDIGSLNRDVSFSLTVQDDTGLSPRHSPKIYLSEYGGSIITLTHHTAANVNPTTRTYMYTTVLPPMFGYNNITLSVYGIVDSSLNMNGYSTVSLMDGLFEYVLMTTCTTNQPIITGSNLVYPHGGAITLYGHGFGNNTIGDISVGVDYKNGNGIVQLPSSSIVLIIYNLMIINIDPVTSSSITVQVTRGAKVSNSFDIIRTDYLPSIIKPPPPISEICPGTPLCGGSEKGNCTSNGCECIAPWSGSDCSSTTIVVPPPIVNPDDPIVIINTGNSSSGGSSTGTTTGNSIIDNETIDIKSIVSIYSIRELNVVGKVVNEYFPTRWSFSNISDIPSFNYGDFRYLYSTVLLNNSTVLNVTIQWLQSESEISFAGQKMTLHPYTTKMSFYVSSYPFQTVLNTLQIVLSTQVSSNKNIFECAHKGKQYDDVNDLQWLKLSINEQSLYGNFIKRGVVDGRSIVIRNSLLDSQIKSSNPNTQSFIGINVPNYISSVYLDPDFSHLLDVDGKGDKSSCQTSSPDTKSKFPTGAIIGIVLGCFAVTAVIGGILLYRKVKHVKNQQEHMNNKLKNMNK